MSERTIVYVASHNPEHPNMYGTLEPVLVGSREEPRLDPVSYLGVPAEYAELVRDLIYDAAELKGALVAIEWSGDIGASQPVERMVSDAGFDPTCKVLYMPGTVLLPRPQASDAVTGVNYGHGIGALFIPRTEAFAKNHDTVIPSATPVKSLVEFISKNAEGLSLLWCPDTPEVSAMSGLRLQVSSWLDGTRLDADRLPVEALIIGSSDNELTLLAVELGTGKARASTHTFKHGAGKPVGEVGGVIRRTPGRGYSLTALQYLDPIRVTSTTVSTVVVPMDNLDRVLDMCRLFKSEDVELIVDVQPVAFNAETYGGYAAHAATITIHLSNAFKMKIKATVLAPKEFYSVLKLKYDRSIGFYRAEYGEC